MMHYDQIFSNSYKQNIMHNQTLLNELQLSPLHTNSTKRGATGLSETCVKVFFSLLRVYFCKKNKINKKCSPDFARQCG